MAYRDKIIEKRIREKQKRIDKRISIKDRNIAYFNSLNSAISFLQATKGDKFDFSELLKVRDQFYAEWEIWYQDLLNKIEEEEKKKEQEEFDALKEAELDLAEGGYAKKVDLDLENLPEIEA